MLVVGSGGREHAIAWSLSRSAHVKKVYVAPGNGGTFNINVPIPSNDIPALFDFARKNDCLTVVGPEVPISLGIADYFQRGGLEIFCPTRNQARIETSKAYAKQFMKENSIPTADFEIFSDPSKALEYLKGRSGSVVVKADGLAAGKGVSVCDSIEEAKSAIRMMMVDKVFGDAGSTVVVEEKLEGREASLFAICNGRIAIPFCTAKDHKRLLDGDRGPNTGGMGAYSPSTDLGDEIVNEILEKVMQPVVSKTGFRGFLYAGLILTSEGPKVLEFNCRLGDPETQAILPRLESDFFELVEEAASFSPSSQESHLDELSPRWSQERHSCCVVMCAEGYPSRPVTGDLIVGIEKAQALDSVTIFHSATRFDKGSFFTAGGRVLSVTAVAGSLKESSLKAYEAVSRIKWRGEYHRRDIGRNEGS